MKTTLIASIFALSSTLCLAGPYTYEVTSDEKLGGLTLENDESLLMTGGEMLDLNLHNWSLARIEGTAPLVAEGFGGIWQVRNGDYGTLDILGGDIHELDVAGSCRTTISGGSIDELWSYQGVGQKMVEGTDPPVFVPDPHIEMIVRNWSHDEATNILTGTWEDFSTFDIQLVDVDGYDPAIDNIAFTVVPEPTSLALLGLGILALQRRRA